MTIAIAVKVHNGVVLAADSASTLTGMTPEGQRQVVNVFNSARKIFRLHEDIKVPIGLMVWGEGSIGSASISILAKDLRQRFMDKKNQDFFINSKKYKLEDVAKLTKRFLFDEIYMTEFVDKPYKPFIGFMIAGYSANEGFPEIWAVQIEEGGNCPGPTLLRKKEDIGINWAGEKEPITRIIKGHSELIGNVLQELGVPADQIAPAVELIGTRLNAPLAHAPMPIQDSIDLAVFLVDTAINFSRFMPGPPTVGGPVDVAAITKHEGFRWVQRKFWFETGLNP
jgi:hypothetical protein